MPSPMRPVRTTCRLRHGSPSSTTTGPCGPSSRSTSSSPLRWIASRTLAPEHPEWKYDGALPGGPRRRPRGARSSGADRDRADCDGDARRHDERGVRSDRSRLVRDRPAPALRSTVHRARLPADGRGPRPPSGQRVQDFRCFRRRHRIHARDLTIRCTGSHRTKSSAAVSRSGTRCGTGRRCSSVLAKLDFFDDKEGKPAAIQKFIGQRPIAAFGNSDGDQQMLQWTAAGPGRSLTVLVDHTDADREFDYRVSPIGDPEARPRRGRSARLDSRQHEGRLEGDLRLRVTADVLSRTGGAVRHRLMGGQGPPAVPHDVRLGVVVADGHGHGLHR